VLVVRLPVRHKRGGRREQLGKKVVREEECTHTGAPSQATQITQRTRPNTPEHIVHYRIGRDSILGGSFNLQEKA
jgi:hypothetical protein